jgi:hypothetical protein
MLCMQWRRIHPDPHSTPHGDRHGPTIDTETGLRKM